VELSDVREQSELREMDENFLITRRTCEPVMDLIERICEEKSEI